MKHTNRETPGLVKTECADTLTDERFWPPPAQEQSDATNIVQDLQTAGVHDTGMSFCGFLSAGDKLLAVPWTALTQDAENKRLVLIVENESLRTLPEIQADEWASMANPAQTGQFESPAAWERWA